MALNDSEAPQLAITIASRRWTQLLGTMWTLGSIALRGGRIDCHTDHGPKASSGSSREEIASWRARPSFARCAPRSTAFLFNACDNGILSQPAPPRALDTLMS